MIGISRAAADGRIAAPAQMLVDQPRAAPRIATRRGRRRADQNVDLSGLGDAEHAEAEPPAEIAEAGIRFPALTTPEDARGEPDLVAGRRAVDGLQHQLEAEAQLELADDHERRLIPAQRYEIAAADLTFDDEPEAFEISLHRRVERGLHFASMHQATDRCPSVMTVPPRVQT